MWSFFNKNLLILRWVVHQLNLKYLTNKQSLNNSYGMFVVIYPTLKFSTCHPF